VKQEVSVCCPVCGTWFYRKPGLRTKFDKDLCRAINQNRLAKLRKQTKKHD
jgi:hypothetical protein